MQQLNLSRLGDLSVSPGQLLVYVKQSWHDEALRECIDSYRLIATGIERIVTVHFRVQTPCCAHKAKFLASDAPA